MNQNGDRVLLGLNDRTAGVFDTTTGSRLFTITEEGRDTVPEWGFIRAVSYSPDSSLLVVGFIARTIGVWHAVSGELVAMLRHPTPLRRFAGTSGFNEQLTTSVSISSDNRYVFAGFGDMSAMVWEISTGKIVLDAFRHVGHVVRICMVPEGLRWATTCGDVWQVGEEGEPATLLESGDHWWEAVFNPAGNELITRRPGEVVMK